jgi:hypothetical protein
MRKQINFTRQRHKLIHRLAVQAEIQTDGKRSSWGDFQAERHTHRLGERYANRQATDRQKERHQKPDKTYRLKEVQR